MRVHSTPLVLVLLATAACAGGRPAVFDQPGETLAGHLTLTEAGSWLEPCSPIDGSERLWVTFTEGSVGQVEEARSAGRLPVGERRFASVRAVVTDGRHIGPGGPALLVRSLLELRDPSSSDCGSR